MVGGVLSKTVKPVEQVLVFPAASQTLTVIVWVPRPTVVAAVGFCDLPSEPVAVQLSDATTPLSTFGIVASQLASAELAVAAGQLTVGAVVSTTVKLVVQVLVFPAASHTLTVIVCVPR